MTARIPIQALRAFPEYGHIRRLKCYPALSNHRYSYLSESLNGDIFWFNVRGFAGGHDLREADSAESLVVDAFSDFRPKPARGVVQLVRSRRWSLPVAGRDALRHVTG
jgi:hypothetical protein